MRAAKARRRATTPEGPAAGNTRAATAEPNCTETAAPSTSGAAGPGTRGPRDSLTAAPYPSPVAAPRRGGAGVRRRSYCVRIVDEGGVMADRPAPAPEASVAVGDPYRLDPDGVREPPTTWRGSLRFFGPGLIVSASIVGAGELITATALGAEAGFVLLWLVIFSTLVKVAVQVE